MTAPPQAAEVDLAIVGGGATGLLLAWLSRRARPDSRVVVLESAASPGGVVATVEEDGFRIERAASALRPGASAILATARELGLGDEIVESSRAARRRFILRGGELVKVPGSPLGLIATPLLSGRAKLRLLREPWVARGGAESETLAHFVARRFGEGIVEPMLDAVVTGIFAGDPRRLEARSAFPRLVEAEREHGSVLRGLIRARRETKAGATAVAATAPRGRARGLLAFRGGMQQLIERLARELGEAVRSGQPVVRLTRLADPSAARARDEHGDGERDARDGAAYTARRVVLATPAWTSARLLAPIDATLARELAAIEAANVAVVGIGVRREQIRGDIDGLGFLVPSREGTPLLGVLYESALFPGRAPDGHVLLRAMVGGERVELSDDARAVAKLAWLETCRVLRIDGAPRLLRAFLHRPGIPQYRPGHAARLARVEERLKALSGLDLAGWCYRGIALDERAREAAALA